MRDAEFVLRYFTFRKNWSTFTGGMKRHMDRYMADNQRPSPNALKEAREDFYNTLEVVESAFGEHAFQRWEPKRKQWRHQVLAALYDAQMFACRGRDPEQVRPKRAEILGLMKDLFSDEDFRRSIDAATNTPSFFRSRIRQVSDILDMAVAD
jgi:hypothetical protein